jgi:LPXTG-site transpeptidase (sortase) family protein
MKSSGMLLTGSILVAIGLANSILGLRQTPSPFDIVNEQPASMQNSVSGKAAIHRSKSTKTIQNAVYTAPAAEEFAESDQPAGMIPDRLVISSIGLDSPIISTKVKKIKYDGHTYYQWKAPNNRAIGWHDTSSLLGLPGNTVLSGHHNVYGEVFKDLVAVHEGDVIKVYSGEKEFKYQVALVMLLSERFESLSIRLENARWIHSTPDERLTLITCWPYDSNTHRVIVVALPLR